MSWKCISCEHLNPDVAAACSQCGTAHASEKLAGNEMTPSPPAAAAQPVYDNKAQFDRISAYLIPGEILIAVYDCKGGGTGFVGITDRRIIFYDQAFLTNKKAMVSLPYNQVIGVASVDEGVIFHTSEITLITAAGRYAFQFRGADKAHWVYTYITSQLLNQAHPQLRG